MGTIFCYGDALIQLFPRDPGAQLEDAIYFKKHLGGGAAVSAYAAAALGAQAAFAGNIPGDGFGDHIRYILKTAGVSLAAASNRGEDTPIMLVKDLKNGGSAGIFLAGPVERPLPGDFSRLAVSPGDLLHLAPQCVYAGAEDTLGELITLAARSACPLSFSLDSRFTDPQVMATIDGLLRERGDAFALGFLSEQSLERLGNCGIAGLFQEVFRNAAALFLFKNDGNILFCPKNGIMQEAGPPIVPQVSGVNRQAVFAGAFLGRCMATGPGVGKPVFPGEQAVLWEPAVLEEAFHFAAAAAALGASHRSGLFLFPASGEVEKLLRQGGETAAQRETRIRLEEQAAKDYYRLQYHVMPPGGWMNDPNGLVQYRGNYHVFYQYYPYAPEWGPMHWGHAVSSDLVHWTSLPPALTPDKPYEKGCFSGSAVDNQGELTLIYTAHDDTRSPKEVQCVALSTDGVNFSKYENNPVIPGPPAGFGEDFRDPKVFRHGDLWYLAAGCTRDKRGGIQLYSSRDLRHWDCRGLACKSDGAQGDMWECPDLFPLGDAWVLICSPMNMKNAKTIFISGDMDFQTPALTQKRWGNLDYGFEFYAPQTFLDERGRRILIGWMDMWCGEFPTQKNGWAGALTFPRELFLRDGEVWQRPVEECALLRRGELCGENLALKEGRKNNLPGIRGDCMEIAFSIPVSEKGRGKLSLILRASENCREKTLLSYDFAAQSFSLDKRQSGAGKPFLAQLPQVDMTGVIPVHILVDRSSVEAFLYGGKYTVTSRIYPKPASIGCDVFVEGRDITLQDFRVWELGS